MLEVETLSVKYGAIQALSDITLTVGTGETVAVIGANGAGKSTLMMTIMGFTRDVRGSIRYKDTSIRGLSPHRIANMGLSLVPEGREVFATLTVAENLRLGLKRRISSIKDADWNHELESVYTLFPRLRERYWQEAGTLSGGEQQMLVMARALLGKPELLLLDEPSLGLSPVLVAEVFAALASLKRSGTTIILVEQLATKALQLADRGYVLENGNVRLSGTGAELLNNPDVAKAYLGA